MAKECRDHLGNVYSSIKDMCDFYKISIYTYKKRINSGWTVKDALTTPVKSHNIVINGKCYSSIKEACSCLNKPYGTIKRRLSEGYTITESFSDFRVDGNYRRYSVTINGVTYLSLKDACIKLDKDYEIIKARRKFGYSLEEAFNDDSLITHKAQKKGLYGNEKTVLYKGKCFTYKEIYQTYCLKVIPYRIFYKRIVDKKWAIEEAISIPPNLYIGEYRVAECLKRLNVKFYHNCSIKTIFADLGISANWNDFLSELQSRLGFVGYNWSKQKIQRLRPDFVLYTDEDNKIRGVIEFDGEQHQNFVEFFFKTIEEFYRRSDTDFVKQSFWEYMNIPMLRIRHDQIDMIDYMVQDFIDNPQNYIHNHNTYLSEEEYWSILTEQKQQIELAFAT